MFIDDKGPYLRNMHYEVLLLSGFNNDLLLITSLRGF